MRRKSAELVKHSQAILRTPTQQSAFRDAKESLRRRHLLNDDRVCVYLLSWLSVDADQRSWILTNDRETVLLAACQAVAKVSRFGLLPEQVVPFIRRILRDSFVRRPDDVVDVAFAAMLDDHWLDVDRSPIDETERRGRQHIVAYLQGLDAEAKRINRSVA